MPRVYKPDPHGKRYKRYSKELIEQALREYKEGSNSLSNVAEKYQINKSVLYRHSIKNVKTQGGQTVLSKETELAFIKYINVCAEWGYPMELFDLRILVKKYLDKLGVTEKRFKNNLPGPDFARSFLKRHSNIISQRVSQNIKRNRAAVSPDVIKEYFEQLKNSISDVPIENIVNYDETNLADDPGRKKIITKRGTKYPERVMNSSKAAVSIMMACTAAGEILPPYVVYKAQNLFDTWIKSGPKGARYNRSQSGWFDCTIFEDWVTSMIIPFFENKPGKKCLIGDNLSSHLSIDLIRKCYEKDIHFIFLPANSTHLTQPLDVAFFRPMKIAWRNIILQWKKTDGRNQSSIPKGCFPKLLSKLMENLKENGSANVISGFRKTGINPFDPSAVLKKLPDWDNQAEQPEIVDETILDYLKEMRYGTNNIVEPKKKKKLQVQAGKSVLLSSDEDYIETTDPEYIPSLILNEKKKQRNEKILDGVTKGKGKGKKTKYNIKNDCKENDPPERENQLDNAVPSCSYTISPYDVNNMPVIFEDDLDGIGQIETIVENEENAPVPKEKKKQKNEKSMDGVSNKGKGKGKNTKTYNKTDCKENDPPKHENQQVDHTVACCSYNISPYDVNNMPVIFEDDLDVLEQIETIVKNNENENNSKKIEITSDVVVSDAEIKRLLNKPVPKSKSRRPSYYKNDADILKDLMELD